MTVLMSILYIFTLTILVSSVTPPILLNGTCCAGPYGRALCCNIPNAACCENALSCCPKGYFCIADGSCSRLPPQFQALAAIFDGHRLRKPQVPTSLLPQEEPFNFDRFNTCSSEASRCGLKNGSFSCCPFKQAECCGDDEHCCPQGYTCDIVTKSCRLSAQSLGEPSQECSLEASGCESTNTCCFMFDGTRGCCPYAEADCCTDGMHCCPKGMRCTESSDACEPARGGWLNPFLPGFSHQGRPRLAKPLGESLREKTRPEPEVGDNTAAGSSSSLGDRCPDHKSFCPGATTCCMMTEGVYGCCPYVDAACCKDGQHCCPNGYRCTGGGICVLSNGWLPRPLAQQPNLRVEPFRAVEEEEVTASAAVKVSDSLGDRCPDGKSVCPNKQTCCLMAKGVYGCCPLESATCCPDGEHCCPHGYSCAGRGRCVPGKGSWIPFTPTKAPSTPSGVRCSDGKTSCPDTNTCCLLVDGSYGCCPLPKAVCCGDHVHCCPENTVCDETHARCLHRGANQLQGIPWFTKTPGSQNTDGEQDSNSLTKCGSGSVGCARGSTCCHAAINADDEDYGCCPYENAVCCGDANGHCCPPGYSCAANGQCVAMATIRINKLSSSSKARFLPWYGLASKK